MPLRYRLRARAAKTPPALTPHAENSIGAARGLRRLRGREQQGRRASVWLDPSLTTNNYVSQS